ncbi:hypothetical protein [Emticicia soli]|uniref:Uncharacterized protein n=1 Tax=Emticicia soli TaxID=2027878 RepID=A0ABW5J902_9BACT
MKELLSSWQSKLISLICLLVIVFAVVSTLRQCSQSTQTIGSGIANVSPIAIKQNTEIVALNQRIETLENKIDSLTYQLHKIDSVRNENFANTPNKSIRSSYSDIAKRYTKQR